MTNYEAIPKALAETPVGFCQCGCGSRTKIATRTYTQRGIRAGHPYRFIAGHQRRLTTPPYIEQDCGYDTPCWVWQRHIGQGGYGRTASGIGGVNRLAHRVYYERHNGVIPNELQLDHLCRNRACVNPAHLEPVTNVENCRRGLATKLREVDVSSIKHELAAGVSQTEIATSFGVGKGTINHIARGRLWRDVL